MLSGSVAGAVIAPAIHPWNGDQLSGVAHKLEGRHLPNGDAGGSDESRWIASVLFEFVNHEHPDMCIGVHVRSAAVRCLQSSMGWPEFMASMADPGGSSGVDDSCNTFAGKHVSKVVLLANHAGAKDIQIHAFCVNPKLLMVVLLGCSRKTQEVDIALAQARVSFSDLLV